MAHPSFPTSGFTTDHEQIRCWIQHHHGAPARIPGPAASAGGGTITLLVDFLGRRPGPDLEHISWQQWFAQFDDAHLVFRFPAAADDPAFQLCRRRPSAVPHTRSGPEAEVVPGSESRARSTAAFGHTRIP